MYFNSEKHHRRSVRLKGYDYSSAGIYFITICIRDKENLLGIIKSGEMKLNPFGEIVKEEWIKSISIRGNISLGEYVIMPNHFHGIIQINFTKGNDNNIGEFRSPSQTIGAIIRGFKGATTKRIKILIRKICTGESQLDPTQIAPTQFTLTENIDLTKSIWQRDYYDIIIRDKKAYDNISNYIIDNPKKWKEDNFNKS